MLLKRVKIPNRTIENYTIIKKDRENIYLSGITSDIWNLLDKDRSYDLILNRLKSKYPAKERDVENTLMNFIGYLEKRELLKTNNIWNRIQPCKPTEPKRQTNSLGTEINKFYYQNKFIQKADLELTYKCNLDCKHCYNMENHNKELSTAEWKNVMDQLADMGCINLAFTGGEVLTIKDFLDLLEYACRKEFSIRLKSNGVFITQEVAKVFRSCMSYLLDVEISLYGTTPKTHDWFTRRPGSFEKSYQGIKKHEKGRNLCFR